MKVKKRFRYRIEFAFVWLTKTLFSILPPKAARCFARKIGETIGPMLGKSKTVEKHIRLALPEENSTRINKKMWGHLGCLMAEYPHLSYWAAKKTNIEGHEILEDIAAQGKGIFFVSGHIGNWEVMPHAIKAHHGLIFHSVFRPPNNPFVADMLAKMRNPSGEMKTISKSKQGMRDMMKMMRAGEHIGMLVDQKFTQGTEIPFFGMPAKTATSFITMCQKFNYAIVPGVCFRTEDGFTFELLPPLDIENRTEKDVMLDIHKILENWIRAHPEQWLWLHRRWGKTI